MRLTTKGRYAVTAMMDLAIHQNGSPVTLNDIAEHQELSLSYLEQLFARLRKSKLVQGIRGPRGGYQLAKAPSEITIAEIITAVDESVDVTQCRGRENCNDGEQCLTHELWSHLSNQMYQFLDSITLAEVVAWPCVQAVAARQDAKFARKHFDGTQATVSLDSLTIN
jgi:Rrf2 family iron-sulfur cluster assembly transcriptional regulator